MQTAVPIELSRNIAAFQIEKRLLHLLRQHCVLQELNAGNRLMSSYNAMMLFDKFKAKFAVLYVSGGYIL